MTVHKRRKATGHLDSIAARLCVGRDDVAEAIEGAVFVVACLVLWFGTIYALGAGRMMGWW